MLEDAIRELVAGIEQAMRRVIQEERGPQPQKKMISQAPSSEEFVTIADAEHRFSVSKSTLKEWMREGLIRRYGRGRMVRVKVSEIVDVMSSSPVDPDAEPDQEFASEVLKRRQGK